MTGSPRLSAFQHEVAHTFFALPQARGFLLAGGAALSAAGAVQRETDDLDFFAPRGSIEVSLTKDAFIAACQARGWTAEVVIDSVEFVRLIVSDGSNDLPVDMGVDSDRLLPPIVTVLGPTISVEENAGRKTLALFGRWMPRDFVDVYTLAGIFGKERLLTLAQERDYGFDVEFFAQALDQVTRINPERFPIAADHVPGLIEFFTTWAAELHQSRPLQ
ncbi:MAG: nucleotidyl transferase AbiEii/AbiGii toxin family protein [Bifidobacteriaceae bacterium]|nr:nucleotidyl transferase AbiEii/AbiGii toxin family protein [Bifidobacteriaceae bacterium]